MDIASCQLDRANGRPLYLQLSDALAGAIERGVLPIGDRLLSERVLATRLGVSHTTAVNAYRELTSRGLVRGHVGRGTYVCAVPEAAPDLTPFAWRGKVALRARRVSPSTLRGLVRTATEPDLTPFAWRGKVALRARRVSPSTLRGLVRTATEPDLISFAAGICAMDQFPTAAFQAATERALARGAVSAVGLSPTEGHPRLRRAIAARAGLRPEEVLVVAGAQQGLDLVARCLIDPGDVVILDRPGYLGAIHAFRAAGAHLIGWDARRDDLDALDELITRYRPKLLYTTPTYQNPTGRTLSLPARRELLDLAARHRLPIIEDDPYGELGFGSSPPLASLRALDQRRLVIHLGTFAKTLAGGLRLGWVEAAASTIDQLASIKGNGDVSSPTLTQLVVADLMMGGVFDRHLDVLRVEHARRHAAMLTALRRAIPVGVLTIAPVAGGLYLWCQLGNGVVATEVLKLAREAGVVFAPGPIFYPDSGGRHQLRLCFSSQPPELIETGIQRFGALPWGNGFPVAPEPAGTVPIR